MTSADLDDWIEGKVEQYVPAPLVVSETALNQLRPVFAELLEIRVALEDIIVMYEQNPSRVGEMIDAAHVKLRRFA